MRCVPGTELDVLSGLGNGFDLAKGGAHPILLGGGIGIAPLYGLAQRMLEAASPPQWDWDSAPAETPFTWRNSASWAAA